MDTTGAPLVLTKICLPGPRPRTVSRPRLMERLIPGSGAGLILVVAPAGYGKSTLLAEWSRALLQEGVAVAWYALDAGDDAPISFGSYLVASLAQALGPLAEFTHLTQLLRASPEVDLQRILPGLINAVAADGRHCALVLDDYHLLGTPAIHTAMAFLLDHLPDNLHVIIGSRSDPPLHLARLRARGQLLEVRAADLRFVEAETAQFLNGVMQLELSADGIAALEERTEGWIAGLQLAALSLAGRAEQDRRVASFSGSHRYLVEYLLEEVVNRQAEEVQAFLLGTSILERICAPLCDAILGTASPNAPILEYLEQANLFLVALDEQGCWYRYHHLFRDFLQSRLRKTQPERSLALHRAACEWLTANELLREAAGHAFQVHDWEYAAAFVEQHCFTMIIRSEIATLYAWCSAIPEEVMGTHPMLCILQALALAYNFQRQNQARIEARLRQVDQLLSVMENRQTARELTEFATVARTFLSMAPDPTANSRELLVHARDMVGAYPQGDPGQFTGVLLTGYANLALHEAQAAAEAFETARHLALSGHLFFGVVESTFHLARLIHSQGQLRRAVEICRQGQADITALLPHPEQDLPALGCLDVALGCVLMEQDRLDEAESQLRRGLDWMGWGMNPYYLMTAYTGLFRLCEIQGRSAEALECLEHLEAAWPDLDFYTHGLRVWHRLRAEPEDPGARASAAAWCQEFSPPAGEGVHLPGMGPIGAAEAYYLAYVTWVRLQIATGNAQAALPYLTRQLDLSQAHGLSTRIIELSLLKAQALRANGDRASAWTVLERALALARPEGFVRIFDQGAALTHLLVEAAQRGICREYIAQILAAIGAREAAGSGREAEPGRQNPVESLRVASLTLVEPLSQRELEVLRLMARGASNQEIAGQLVITVGTVKSHINHILGKLEARNRTEAVARARGMGLPDL
jgi:ATP/maltotriose-dependent transcriptional regulator MalT